jgi:hypothetical protein
VVVPTMPSVFPFLLALGRHSLVRFAASRGGNVSSMFALAVVPMIGAVGGAIDYGSFYKARAAAAAAADASTLAAVGYSGFNTEAAKAKSTGLSVFNAQLSTSGKINIDSAILDVVDEGLSRKATLTYTGAVKTSFIGVLGINTIQFSGSSVASVGKAPFMDFYVLLDNSPSMGLGATTADINKMVANTSDKCAFACHDTGSKDDYYSLSQKLGVTLRVDVVRSATQKLIDTAIEQQGTNSNYRIGIYTYGASASALKLTKNAPLQSNLPNAKSQAASVKLMSVNTKNIDYMYSPHAAMLSQISDEIPSSGDGTTQQQAQKILFYVSDGTTDANLPVGCTKPLTGKRCQMPLDPTKCNEMKSRGVKVAVLYTTYLPLPTNGWYNSWIAPWQSQISTKMQECASPGLFFEVSPSQGIEEAMVALFMKATASAHLTH